MKWRGTFCKVEGVCLLKWSRGGSRGGSLGAEAPPSGLRYNIIDTASQLLTVVEYTVLM